MADHYAEKMAEASSASYTVTQHAARGAITDRSGHGAGPGRPPYTMYTCGFRRRRAPNLRETVKTIAGPDRRQGCGNTACRLLFCRFGRGAAGDPGRWTAIGGRHLLPAPGWCKAARCGWPRGAYAHWPDGTIAAPRAGLHGAGHRRTVARCQGRRGWRWTRSMGQSGLEAAYDDPAARAGRPAARSTSVWTVLCAATVQTSHPCTRRSRWC